MARAAVMASDPRSFDVGMLFDFCSISSRRGLSRTHFGCLRLVRTISKSPSFVGFEKGHVSARILAELEAGALPWVKPWSATPGANTPCNAVTNRPYSGCNVVLLWMAQAAGYRTPRFLTFKQAVELGGHVRKGDRGTKVYFVKQLEIHEGADGNSPTRLPSAACLRRRMCPLRIGVPVLLG